MVPIIAPVDHDAEEYELVESFTFTIDGEELEVPVGFQTDGASIPAFLWGYIGHPFMPKVIKAAIAHDYLYSLGTYKRKTVDKVLLNLLLDNNVNTIKAHLIYCGVRCFGWMFYGN